MRVPLPDISAREPSVFQIASSTQSSPARRHLEDAVRVADSGANAFSVERLVSEQVDVPARASFEDLIGDLVRRTIGGDASKIRNPPHPLPLVGGEPLGTHETTSRRLVGWELGDLVGGR